MARRKICRIVSSILLFFTVTGILAFSAGAENGQNYSYPHATKTEDIYFDEIADACLPSVSLSELERDYLRRYADFLLSYNYGIPTSCVTTEYDSVSGELLVLANEYGYTAENGVAVIWRPVSVTLYSEEKPLFEPEYSAAFFTDSAASGDFVKVKYKADFIIGEDEVNRLLNLTYNDAVKYKAEIEEKTEEYERALEAHRLATEEYNEYVAALALYRQYLSEKRIYDEELAEYNAYLEELAAYELQKAEYDAYDSAMEKYYEDYAKYKEYLAYASKYESKILAYEKYVKEMETVKAQLAVIESTKIPVTHLKRTLYGAITGDTVSGVIANKDAIANNVTGADPATIDRAGAATENLRALFDGYFSAKGESEKYNYYVTNYEGFRDNFAELLRTLDKLYMNRKVRGVLIAEGKQEKYIILLAQLYYATNALSDEPVKNYDGDGYFDAKYLIGKGTDYYPDAVSPAKALNNEEFVTDTDSAEPLENGYPTAVEKPDFVSMEEPKMPTRVPLPILPESVSPPTKSEPTRVSEPTAVDNPGPLPTPYVAPDGALDIVAAYDKGELTQRPKITEPVIYSPEISVRKTFIEARYVTVKYYGEKTFGEGVELIYETTVEAGTYADYAGAQPVKMESKTHTYSHTGWVDADGNPVDCSSISENIDLYADFTATEKDYKTSWSVNGAIYDVCPTLPTVSDAGNKYYVFSRWEKTYAIDPVTKESTIDVIWVARFDEHRYVVTDSGYVDLAFDGTNYEVFVKGDTKMDIGALIDAAAGEGGIVIYASNATLKFSYAETIALKSAGVRSLEINAVQKASLGGYAYSVDLYGEEGALSEHKARLGFEAYCTADDPTHLCLYTEDGGEKKSVKFTFFKDKSRINFTMTSGTRYVAREEYSIKPISLEGITIGLDKPVAKRGDTVQIFIDKAPGISISRVYMKHSDGTETEIKDGSFTMPADDLAVCVDFVIEEYVVSFVSEGKTIASYICRYGDEVTPPTPPSKASYGKYKYTFVGWDAEILPATQDTVYTAIYKQELLPRDNTDKGLQITPSVLKILLLAASLAIVILFAVIPSAIILAVMLLRRRKRRLKP